MVKRPAMQLNNPAGAWFEQPLRPAQLKKSFSIISCMVYLCDYLHCPANIKQQIIELVNANPRVPVYKYGFLNNWQNEPLWQ